MPQSSRSKNTKKDLICSSANEICSEKSLRPHHHRLPLWAIWQISSWRFKSSTFMPICSFQCKHWNRNTLPHVAKLVSNSHCILTAPSFIGPLAPAALLSSCACSRCLLSSLFFFARSALLGLSCPQSSASHSSWPQSSSGDFLLCVSAAAVMLVRVDSSNGPSPLHLTYPLLLLSTVSALDFFLLWCEDFRFPEPLAAVLLFTYGWMKIFSGINQSNWIYWIGTISRQM